jgi:double-stranded uracil-DNA glycosylase
LFSGINPGLYSAAVGQHFARPGNRFWPALHRAGFTPRLLRPDEQDQLLDLGLGITNIVARATARADELRPGELREGGRMLGAKVGRLRPGWLAIVGVTPTGRRSATPGPGWDRRTRPWAARAYGCCPTPAGSTPTGRRPGWPTRSAS